MNLSRFDKTLRILRIRLRTMKNSYYIAGDEQLKPCFTAINYFFCGATKSKTVTVTGVLQCSYERCCSGFY